ncbi:unnamed protein product [Orchesella dallaii]|uniref:SnoaL-like domain-containing protein n=1 Tax=Orchesella dallaii TaxID=48710 RepID=A0ABP1RHN4_9HEXA
MSLGRIICVFLLVFFPTLLLSEPPPPQQQYGSPGDSGGSPGSSYGPPGYTPGQPLGLDGGGGSEYGGGGGGGGGECFNTDLSANKQLVMSFYQDIFGDKKVELLEKYVAPDLINHNPMTMNGIDGLRQALAGPFGQGPPMKIEFMRVAADGDLGWTHIKLRVPAIGMTFAAADIFRINCQDCVSPLRCTREHTGTVIVDLERTDVRYKSASRSGEDAISPHRVLVSEIQQQQQPPVQLYGVSNNLQSVPQSSYGLPGYTSGQPVGGNGGNHGNGGGGDGDDGNEVNRNEYGGGGRYSNDGNRNRGEGEYGGVDAEEDYSGGDEGEYYGGGGGDYAGAGGEEYGGGGEYGGNGVGEQNRGRGEQYGGDGVGEQSSGRGGGACLNSDSNANTKLVINFYQDVFGDKKIDSLEKYVAPDLINHNPFTKNGIDGLRQALEGPFGQGPPMKIQFMRVAADEDLVWTHVKLPVPALKTTFAAVDIFRINCQGLIQEHWDVLQDINVQTNNPQPFF